jgi:ligand-binding sensor domain-containing protein
MFACNIALAQQPFFYKFDDENGFPSNEVYQIEQDDFGFIWIGCDAGIFRYDGVNFKQFIHLKQTGVSISNLKIDEQQRVWCQNFSGQIFYIQNDTIHLFKDFTKETASYPSFTIFDNQMITNINDSTKIYDASTQKLKTVFQNKATTLKFPFYSLLLQSNQDGIYASIRDNIYFKSQNKPYQAVYQTNEYLCFHISVINEKVYAVLREEKTKYWLVVELKEGKIIKQKRFPPNTFNMNVYMIAGVKDGLAICTATGIHLLNKDFEPTHHYFPNEKITDALYDKEGNLWLTSLQNGIYVVPSIDLNIFNHTFFPNANITTLTKQNDDLLIGTYLGDIYAFNSNSQTFKTINIVPDPIFKTAKKIMETVDYQIFAIGVKTVAIDKKTKKRLILGAANVRDMVVWKDSLYYVDPEQFKVSDLKGNTSRSILSGGGRMITKSPNNDTIYIANKNGFFHYIDGKTAQIFKNGEAIYPTCSSWQNDTLWLGTLSEGFVAYHNGRFFNHFYQVGNEAISMVRSIKIHQNWLLLATNIGLARMNLRTKKIDIINGYEGLYQKEIRAIEVINNEIFLGTTKGLIRLPLSINAKNKTGPNINLKAIILNDSILINSNYQFLKYYENNILFQFQTALFRSRKSFYYEFRLKGLNENWQQTNSVSPFAQYRSLPSGSYVFEVRAVNEDGIKSEIKSYSFSIALPIWQRWWFILLVLCLFSTGFYWLVNRRIQNIKRQATLENELKTSQLTALKAQMNPHFLYNALNSIQDLILQKDIPNASRYLTKFSHLMRQILEASGHLGIPLSTEIQILNLYLELEKLRFGDNFQYKITLPERIDLETTQVPSMIIQPFVENAVKHGLLHKTTDVKLLNINFELQDLLICTITDNGIGRKKSAKIKIRQGKKTTSFATSATQKRLEILNQTHQQKIGLEIIDLYENNKATGTKIVLRIPFTSF